MSLFRQHYSPHLVWRELQCDGFTDVEVLDGWERVQALGEFFKNKIPLPGEIDSVFPGIIDDACLRGMESRMYYMDLCERSKKLENFVREATSVYVDVITIMGNSNNSRYQTTITELYRSLQSNQYF